MNNTFWLRRCIVLACLIVFLFPTMSDAATTSGGSITWDPPVRLTSDDRASFPFSVVDSRGALHIVVLSGGSLVYTNNAGGTFKNTVSLATGLSGNKDPYFMLAIGDDDSLHLAYATAGADDAIYYMHGVVSARGTTTWSTAEKVSGIGKAFAANVAVDKNNNVYVTWIEKRGCGSYTAYYRERYANGIYGTEEQPIAGCDFQNQPRVVVTSDNKVHVFAVDDSNVVYARREATGWVEQTLSSGGANYNPTFATDGTALYAAWDGSGHDILFRRSKDGGKNWSNTLNDANSDSFASFPSAAAVLRAGRVYVTWADSFGNADKGDTRIWFREFDTQTGITSDAALASPLSGPSTLPSVAASGARAATVWQDKSVSGSGWRVALTQGTVSCRSTLATASVATSPTWADDINVIFLPLTGRPNVTTTPDTTGTC